MCQMLLSIFMTMMLPHTVHLQAAEYLQNAFVVVQITLHELKLVLNANKSKFMFMLFTS